MFCEKCGNKIKEGYKFCNKCGTKVKEVKKKVEIVDQTKKNIIIEEQKDFHQHNKKSGKGKVILLTILNLILLATTILFLVLWLIKPSDNSCKTERTNNYSTTNENTKATKETKNAKTDKEPSIVGKWEQNVDYKQGNNIVKRTYRMIELKKDGTFNSVHYDKDNMSNSERMNGTYTANSNTVYLNYVDGNNNKQSITLYIDNNKMCVGKKNCEEYLVKDSYNNKIVVYVEGQSDIEYIDYSKYQKIINNKSDAIIVVVRSGCYYCEQFESVVEKMFDNYLTQVYYYEYDGQIDITGTPTTLIIKNGEVIDTIIGYKEYSKVAKILNDNNIY